VNASAADRAHAAIRLFGLMVGTCALAATIASVGFLGLILQVGT
jgi:hypothetical protein